jgi:hypothetical protein
MQYLLVALITIAVSWALSSMGLIRRKNDLELILIGEDHTDNKHPEEEAKLIETFAPEFVLFEGFDDWGPEKTQRFIEAYKIATLKELANLVHISPEDMGINQDTIHILKRKIQEEHQAYTSIYEAKGREGKILSERELKNDLKRIPNSYTGLLNVPLYQLPMDALSGLKEIIIDSTTDETDLETKKQVLDVISKLERISSADQANSIDSSHVPIYRAIAKINGQIVGCDIDKAGLDYKAKEKQENFDQKLARIEENRERRETQMADIAQTYIRKRKTDAPLIEIVGKNHLKKDSHLIRRLNAAGINYKIKILKPAHGKDAAIRRLGYAFK